jgi:hypothetical protein
MTTEEYRKPAGPVSRGPKIAHVSTVDMALRYMLLDQLLSLQESGYEVHGISAGGPNMDFVERAGIAVHDVPLTRRITPLADLRALLALYRVFRREKFALVHTHTPKAGLLGQLAAKLARVPVIVNTVHGFYFHENMPRWQRAFYILTEKIAARCSSLILSQNREDMATAIREGICKPEAIQFLGNGIDVRQFDPRQVDPAVVDA